MSFEIENLNLSDNASGSHVTVEVRLKPGCVESDRDQLKEKLLNYLESIKEIQNWSPVKIEKFSEVDHVLVGCLLYTDEKILHVTNESKFIFYVAKDSEAYAQEITADGDEESSTISSLQWELPCIHFDHLWENLFYEDNVKGELLSFAHSLMELSHRGVDTNIIDLNRLILLSGVPGGGKTTLCKGLSQRLSVRFQHKYKKSIFVEVNSHSLFSKWFSESGKFVQKLFEQITDLASNSKYLIFVLIDEVESLVMSRNSLLSDPSDSVRAVNAVLTQIDKIRRFPNVLVLTTSNITGALDQAFLDRTDISRQIGHPSSLAATKILHKGIIELIRIGVITGECDISQLNGLLANKKNISGRFLKKLPVIAFSKLNAQKTTINDFIGVLRKLVDFHYSETGPKLREIQNIET